MSGLRESLIIALDEWLKLVLHEEIGQQRDNFFNVG